MIPICGMKKRLDLVRVFMNPVARILIIAIVLSPDWAFTQNVAGYNATGPFGLPVPGAMVDLSPPYVPMMVQGLRIHPQNPLLIDFIVSPGESEAGSVEVKRESLRLIKYFFACLAIPEENQWVNLSPYEKQRIIPADLGQTVLGQDMLFEDYLLKQLTASLIYPEKKDSFVLRAKVL
ncbi:MAG: hypothetical protein HQL13_08740, partial [Candidatus Omnitrophica bacterium]|nr:hypothetical protein [Candidatus Omnitrophota bacterium]